MKQFSYSFIITMLHSIWQMAVLVLIYFFLSAAYKRLHPNFKRNVLYSLLIAQIGISIFTFIFYFTNSFSTVQNQLVGILTNTLLSNFWIQAYANYIFYGYSLIVIYKISSLIFHCISFKINFTKNVVKPPVDVRIFTTVKAYQFGVKRKIKIWYSNIVSTPVTFGFLKPVILLPIALLNKISLAETEALIIHEITHIKNNDYLLNWLLLITETIYFYNPFVKIITRKIELEREKSCDTQVIQFKYSPIVYAEILFNLAKQNQQNKRFQLAAVINKSQLLKRIEFFSDNKNQSFRKNNFAIVSLIFILGIFALNIYFLPQLNNYKATVNLAFNNQPGKAITAKDENFEISTVANTTIIKDKTLHKTTIKDKDLQSATITASAKAEINTLPKQEKYVSEEYQVLPVAAKTQAPVLTKEVLVNEETSSGKIVTQVYKVQFINGKWVVQPLWMTTEIKDSNDSLNQKTDSIYQSVNAVQ